MHHIHTSASIDAFDENGFAVPEVVQQEKTTPPPPLFAKEVDKWTSWRRAACHGILLYAALIIVHFVSSNLYSKMCTSQTLHGLIMSPFLVPAPHCEGLRWLVYHGALRINGMWLLIGSQVVNLVTHLFI